jgi:transcription elongation GreA/GreB family factor
MIQFHKLKDDESREDTTEPLYLTQEGLDVLRKQLEKLKHNLPNLAAEAQRTAAYGDRSDNAEYKQAKGALRYSHRQIFTIETQLKRAVVIEKGGDTIRMGSTVVVKSKDGKQKTFEILGSHETDPQKGRISYLSPLGAALINHVKGDTVILVTPAGEQTYRILEVS